jgi:hypothetical protein
LRVDGDYRSFVARVGSVDDRVAAGKLAGHVDPHRSFQFG